ncbi:MAG: sugar ABC transporter ATP-binding protein [Terriglobales bacterium]|jgi:ribose transport system ATP-binding protein
MTSSDTLPALELRGVTKRYGRVAVLRDIDFYLREGEVHGLIGENGAGKSTTVKVLAGVEEDYDGEMRVRGKVVRFRSPADAQDLGIGMVYQELSIFPHLTVAENLFGRNLPCRMGLVDWKRIAREAQRHLNELGLEIDVTSKMGDLPVGSQQVVEIARVVFSGANVIILDEPTSALSAPEIERLFEFVRTLKAQGKSIIFISHFLEDVLAVSDRITVLRDGTKVDTLSASATSKQHLVELMIGERAKALRPGNENKNDGAAHKEVAIRIDDVTLRGEFAHVSLALRRGEVLGLFGFMGAGQIPLGRCLFGASCADSGTFTLSGKRLRLRNTTAAVARGLAYVPEDRHDSLMFQQPMYKNITLAHLKKIVGWRLNRKKEVAAAHRSIENLTIRPPDPMMPVGALSGGNQQKVVLAKWLVAPPTVLILNEPTRGIDIAAKDEVINVIGRLRDQGVSILLISSEPELIEQMAGRALVMRKGKVTAELQGADVTKQNLMQHA